MEKMKRMGIVGSSSAAARGGATERTIGRYGIRVMERSSSQRHRYETYPSSLACRGIVLRLTAVVVIVVVAVSAMTMICHHHDHLVIDHDFRTSNVQGLAGQQRQKQQQPQRSSKTATRRRSWGNVFTRPWIQFVVSGGGSRGGGGYVPVLVDAFTTSTVRRKPRRIFVPEQLLPLLRVPILDGNDDAMIASSSSSSGAANAFPLRATAATSSSWNKKRRCDRASSGEQRHHRYHRHRHHHHHHRHHHHQYPPHRHHHHHPSSHVVGKTVAAISTRAADVVSTCNIKRNHNALHIHQDAAEKPNKNKLQSLLSSSSTSRLIGNVSRTIPPPPKALAIAEQVVSSSTYFDDDGDRININGSNRCSATVAASSASSSFGAGSASAAMAAAMIARSDTAALQSFTPTRMTSSSSSTSSTQQQQQQQQQITAPDELFTNDKYDTEDDSSRITTTTTVTTVTTTTTTTTTTTHNNRGRKKIERWKDIDDHDNSATMDVTPLLLDLDRSNKNGSTEAAAFTGTSSSSGIIFTTTSMPSLAAAATTTTATATSTLQPGCGSDTTGLRNNNVVKDLPAPKLELPPPPPPPPPPPSPPRRSKFKMDHLLLYRRSSMREATAREGRVPYGEESRQYRRTLFDHDDWIEHRNSKRIMSNLTGMFYSGIIRQLREEVALVVGFASLLVLWNGVLVPYVDDLTSTASATAAAVSSASVTAAAAASMWTWKLPHLSLPSLPFQLSSPALGLLLVFRTNASFSRWTDAGTTWARIVAQSRNMVRMAATFTDMADPMQSATVHRLSQATWLYCRTLMHQLSGPTDWQDYREEIMATYSCSDDNIGNNMNNSNNNTMSGSETATRTSSALTRDQRMLQRFLTKPETASDRTMTALAEVSLALDAVPIDEKRRVEIDKAVILLGEFTTLCDRIYTNPVPLVYTRHTARFLSLWMLLLPCALYENFARAESFFPVHGFMVIPAAAAVAVFLFGIEELAVQLEEPFSVLPMQKFCDDVRDANHVLLDWCTESALLARQEGVDDDDDDAARQQQTAQTTAFLKDAYTSSYEEIPRPSIRGTTVLEPNPVAAAFFQDGDDVMPGGKVNGQHRLQPE